MALNERFFGVNNRTILYELGLSPDKDGDLVNLLAQKAIRYAGGKIGEATAHRTLADIIREQPVGLPGATEAPAPRPRYLRCPPTSRCKHLLTIQLIRPLVYPRWLSSPYPVYRDNRLPKIALGDERPEAYLKLGMPLLVDMASPIELPGTGHPITSVTDVELASLAATGVTTDVGVEQVRTAETVIAPSLTAPRSVYQQLDPAWGLFLEGVIRNLCTSSNGKVSSQGRHILSLELAHMAPILRTLQRDPRLSLYGWGNGKIHIGMNDDPEGNLEDLVKFCAQNDAYVFSQKTLFMASPEARGGGFAEAYMRFLEARSRETIESVVAL